MVFVNIEKIYCVILYLLCESDDIDETRKIRGGRLINGIV